MIQADRMLSMPRKTAPESSLAMPELALHLRLKTAGMRLQRVSNDSYTVIWRHQMVVRDLTLLEAALFVHRALDR
jgi:hypothetical protein